MATQTTARLRADLGTSTGTRKRFIGMEYAHFIDSQNNPIAALLGGKVMGPDGKTVRSIPPLIRTRKAKDAYVEGFTQEHIQRVVTVLTGGNAAATSIVLESGEGDVTHAGMLWRNNNTRDVFYQSAISTDTLTIARTTGASAITKGDKLISLGYVRGELSSNPVFVIRDEDQFGNYCVEMYKAFRASNREDKLSKAGSRYVGPSFENQKRMKMLELLADRDNLMLGGKSSSSFGSTGITTPRGLESWGLDGNGQQYLFHGTVERSEVRKFGTTISEYCRSEDLIMVTSLDVIAVFSSVLDDKLQINIEDFKKTYGLPLATAMRMGPAVVKMIPHGFYKAGGNAGRGVVFDAKNVAVYEISNQIEYHEAGAFADSTFASDKRGVYYYDGACIMPLDNGKSVTVFDGALNHN